MEKVSLNKFTQVANFDYIEEPKLILSVVRKMWDIPFDEIFHAKCRYQNPTPWEYIYEEFADQEELIPKGTEAFGALPYGEIALILNEEIRRKSEAAEDMQLDKLISVIRSRNISVSVILQSLTQLQSMYSKEQADTIVTNCDHLLYLGGQDIETARYIGYRSNKTEDHILLMPIGKAYLIERGKLGIMVDRVPPYEIERQSFDKENQKDSESWYETADELIFA